MAGASETKQMMGCHGLDNTQSVLAVYDLFPIAGSRRWEVIGIITFEEVKGETRDRKQRWVENHFGQMVFHYPSKMYDCWIMFRILFGALPILFCTGLSNQSFLLHLLWKTSSNKSCRRSRLWSFWNKRAMDLFSWWAVELLSCRAAEP